MLTIEHLSFSYPQKEVLRDVSFCVGDSDIFAILGRNGAGKTTLINVLTGLLQKRSGVIKIDENHIDGMINSHYFGIMRNFSELYLKMTIYEYLSLVGTLYNVSAQKLHGIIVDFSNKFEFSEHLYKQLRKCSLGTKKKVSFCAAIIHSPRYVVLDEPFDSIDPIVCYKMKSFLSEYAKKKGTVIVTSHALDLVQNFCQKYVIIHNGEVVAGGELTNQTQSLEQIFIDVVGEDE